MTIPFITFLYTILLIAGIALQSMYPIQLQYVIALNALCVYGIGYMLYTQMQHKNKLIVACTIIFAAPLGALLYAYQWHCFDNFHTTLQRQHVQLRAQVYALESTEHLFTKQKIILYLPDFNASIFVYTNKKHDLRVDDTIVLKNCRIKKPLDPEFARYLLKEGVYGTAFTETFDHTLVKRPAWSLRRNLHEWRDRIFNQLRIRMSRQTFALFSALFLGNKSYNKKDTDAIQNLFKRWGIAHIYARSGLHLALFIIGWVALLRFVPLPYGAKQLMLLLIALVYMALSWSSISFLRALCVFFLYQLCKMLRWPYAMIHLIMLVCIGTLLYNPLQLFFLDFQLSFLLTFALILVQHVSYARFAH